MVLVIGRQKCRLFFIYIKHYVYSFMRFLYIITLYKFYFLFRLFGITEMFCRFVMYNGERLAQCRIDEV